MDKMSRQDKSTSLLRAADLMPNDTKTCLILEQRAEGYAKKIIKLAHKQQENNYICFKLNSKECFGISYNYVNEVLQNAAFTKVPCVPSFIAGVINRHGALVSVIDLQFFFHNTPSVESNNSCLIIVSHQQLTVGIRVNEVIGSNEYDPLALDLPIFSEGAFKAEYILGLHCGIATIINIEAIITDLQLQIKK